MPFVTSKQLRCIKVCMFQRILWNKGQTPKWKSHFIFQKYIYGKFLIKKKMTGKNQMQKVVICSSPVKSYALRTDFSLDPCCSFSLRPYLSDCSCRFSHKFQCVSTIFHKNCSPLGSAREFMAYWRWRNLEQTSLAVLTVCRQEIRLRSSSVVSIVAALVSQSHFIFTFPAIYFTGQVTQSAFCSIYQFWVFLELWLKIGSQMYLGTFLMCSRGKSSTQTCISGSKLTDLCETKLLMFSPFIYDSASQRLRTLAWSSVYMLFYVFPWAFNGVEEWKSGRFAGFCFEAVSQWALSLCSLFSGCLHGWAWGRSTCRTGAGRTWVPSPTAACAGCPASPATPASAPT